MLIHAAAGGVGISATQIARNVGRGDLRHRLALQARRDPRPGRRPPDRLPQPRLRGGGDAHHRRRGLDLIIDALGPTSFRKDYRLLRPGGRLVMYGLSEATDEGGRDIPAMLKGLVKMPLATMPWWKSLMVMNENKGVFGLNMLNWWDREGNLDRVTEPLMADLEAGAGAGRRRVVPLRAGRRGAPFIAERRNVGKVVLFP